MREIKFRGKRLDNGEWVYGFYAEVEHNEDKSHKHSVIFQIPLLENPTIDVFIEVNPATVGQYTGKNDRNGKEIYKGDILKGFSYPFMDEGNFNYFAEVIWFDNTPAFGLYTFKNPESSVRGISAGNSELMEDFNSDEWEIIDNIHESNFNISPVYDIFLTKEKEI